LNRHIKFLGERIEAVKKESDEFVQQTPSLKSQRDLLISIPGIGNLTACTLLAEIGDFSAFENAPQLAAYAGLNPTSHRSGSSVNKKARISKEGRKELRCCLYMPAVVALSCNPVIKSLSKRLRERHLLKMEIVVASMRKLLHLAYGVIKTQLPFDPNYGAQFNFSS
jgi:transposase